MTVASALSRATIQSFIERVLGANIASARDARRLSRFPSFHALTLLAHVCMATRAKYQPPGGDDDNHAADVEAVVIALHGRHLVTADRLARELNEDMRIIARTIWA